MPRLVQDVAVVGRDAEAWMLALGLQRAMGGRGGALDVRVRVVELASTLSPAHAYAGLPALQALHDIVGLPEPALFKACRAVPMLGHRLVGWGDAAPFLHAYDIQRPAIDDIDLLQFWTAARGEGHAVPLEDYSLAAMAARHGRISADPGGPDTLAGFVPGFHLDARRYARLVRQGAAQNGIEAVAGPLASIEREGDAIRAITTEEGERVVADLWIDASGAEAVLIGGQPGDAVESWAMESRAGWFGADRIVTASAPPLRPLPAFAQVAAIAHGWVALLPLQDRTAIVAAVAAAGRSDAAVAEQVCASVGVRAPADLQVAPFAPGARPRPWIGNCVAVGGAATQLEPLDAGPLHLAQIGLSHLVALWPVDADRPLEATPYNAAIGSHVANLRDFTLAHHHLAGRAGPAAMPAPIPGTLQAKLSLFAARGQVPLNDDETFQAQNWSACFVGHGLIPRSADPRVGAVPPAERDGKFQRLREVIAAELRTMPMVEDYIAARVAAA